MDILTAIIIFLVLEIVGLVLYTAYGYKSLKKQEAEKDKKGAECIKQAEKN